MHSLHFIIGLQLVRVDMLMLLNRVSTVGPCVYVCVHAWVGGWVWVSNPRRPVPTPPPPQAPISLISPHHCAFTCRKAPILPCSSDPSPLTLPFVRVFKRTLHTLAS